MKLSKTLVCVAFTLSAAPALAQDKPAAAPVQDRNDPDRVVCRTDAETGSILHRKKICMTVAQWRDAQQRIGLDLDKRQALQSRPGG